MKSIFAVFATACFICAGVVSASNEWPNEPTGAQQLVDCPFSGNICNLVNVYNTAAFANDANAPLSGPSVFDTYLAAGSSTGNGMWYYSLRGARELYVGTWWKTNPEFQGMSNSHNKLMVFSGGGGNGYLMWNGPQDQPRTIMMEIASHTENNCHIANVGPDCANNPGFYPNVGNGTISAGSGWHRLEVYQKCSSTATSRDGILCWWVDGRLVGDYRNVNYKPGGFEQFTSTHTWDGGPSCATRDCSRAWHHYWDHLRISAPNGYVPPPPPLAITSPIQTTAQVEKPYSATLQAANGKAPYAWTISAGSLPPGLTLNKTTGVLAGTPTTVGRSDFTVRVMDASVPATEATKATTIIVSNCSGCTGIEEKKLAVVGSQLSVKTSAGRVQFGLPQSGAHLLSVYDLSGREVWRHSGIGEATWNHGGRLQKGIYLVRLAQNNETMNSVFCNVK